MNFQRGVVVFLATLLAWREGALLRSDEPAQPPEPGAKKETFQPLVIRGELTAKDPLDRVLKQSRHKVHEVPLEAGRLYAIELRSAAFDAYLRLEDAAGKQLAQDDDSGGGTDARLLYRPRQGGAYRVIATVLPGGAGTGPYTLTVRLASARDEGEAKAAALQAAGEEHYRRGDLVQAEQAIRQALALRQQLYPPKDYPQGHPDLAVSLNGLGFLLARRGEYGPAQKYYQDAVAMYQRVYSADRYPQGHPLLAAGLNNLGHLLEARGEYGPAQKYYQDALSVLQRLYPADRYPQGHPDLATSLNNLGHLLQAAGEYGPAQKYYQDALAMRQRLYPADRYPQGHANLVASLNNLGGLLKARGDYGSAQKHYQDALAMWYKLYPPDRYPQGHFLPALCLNNLGAVLKAQGEYGPAQKYYLEALAMWHKLYPADRYPQGHPNLALSLNNLGGLFAVQGEYGPAQKYYQDALAMRQRIYPADRYPQGHPDVALSLDNLGGLLAARGEYGPARKHYQDALTMYQGLVGAYADTASEAEAFNFLARLPRTRDTFLALTARLSTANHGDEYALLWQGRAALTRVLEGRGRLLRAATDSPTRQKVEALLEVRRQLATLVLAPPNPKDKDRGQRVRDLAQLKEDRERELAQAVPDLNRQKARLTAPYTDLTQALPPHAAFLDLYHYHGYDAKQRKWDAGNYTAFVLRQGEPVRRVELGSAAPIEQALRRWRQDIEDRRDSPAALELRHLVWDKVAVHLAADTDTVYLCPDGALGSLPWAALPGSKKGSVLLEDHAIALVPHGPGLLDQLRHPYQAKGPNLLLAVGGVAYDEVPAAVSSTGIQVAQRAGEADGRKANWPLLPGTTRELERVLTLAGHLKPTPQLLAYRDRQATVARLWQDLPRARWAHLATHGFFAAPQNEVREALLDDRLFQFGVGLERRGVGARNPLTQSGLVLAGANLPPREGEGPGSFLTGEALAGLNLDGLELAVLSACETGLGESGTTLGEGVFGLTRAFHLGGCRNVVASLWKVDDEATAALMALFYHHLWEKHEPPLQALRQAQLALYRNPKDIPLLAQARGRPDFGTTVRRVTQPPANPPERAQAPAAVRHWAAFVLSGAGR
jgi:CHAT domain-containing protein